MNNICVCVSGRFKQNRNFYVAYAEQLQKVSANRQHTVQGIVTNTLVPAPPPRNFFQHCEQLSTLRTVVEFTNSTLCIMDSEKQNSTFCNFAMHFRL